MTLDTFRIVSFNVNGLRSFEKYISLENISFNDYIKNILKATILCVQESRGSLKSLYHFHTLKDYMTFSSLNKKGIYGVCTFIRKDFICSEKKTILEELKEFNNGRYILTKHNSFDVLNCYFPCINEEEYRNDKNHPAFQFYEGVRKYSQKNKKTIIVGDFNAIYSINDSYIYKNEASRIENMNLHHVNSYDKIESNKRLKNNNLENIKKTSKSIKSQDNLNLAFLFTNGRLKNPSLSPTELPFLFQSVEHLTSYFFEIPTRKWLLNLLKNDYVDTFRNFYSELEKYTCWNQMLNLRKKNLGSRIDLILCPKNMNKFVINADILNDICGSDHCPVIADFEMEIEKTGKNILKSNNNLLSFFKKK